ncbi:tRNA (adenosine(37)-N6)-threonylcarbamoyltransferase complex ATPase subunit type 1 TsaE [Rhizobium rhizoryzae]|uniref:tRNA (adenosine(37)-N6)-threonylcarbamoyltransferase complex ATPase subunit type 1 TsaE n=1 Tax=Rhizobium rhizoryzae TaxID=451876 RepID=UPI002899D899|nr:tRNA (adenosine(37)-N6)-threonylcarbamoyltransferase complex ATPase subunit type 1 TsaE [Rhizobium rhizoryzae]
MSSASVISLLLQDEAETIRLGEDLALALKPGDCLCLSGDLGAGKSTLARAFIRAMAEDSELEVPSPTFTLVQSYDLRIPISHFDLYRLADGSELDELGLDEALSDGICLVEWPEMADTELPKDRIRLTLMHEGAGRRVEITGSSTAMARISRALLIRQFLTKHGYADGQRRYLTGDASLRAYETLLCRDGKRYILMDWPRRPDGPPVLDGKPYPKVAHLAEEVLPFVAIAQYLRDIGLRAPDIVASDFDSGLLLLEDLGQSGVLDDGGKPITERYMASIDCLAHLHHQTAPTIIAVDTQHQHQVPPFDPVAMKIETRLLIDWYLPWKNGGIQATDIQWESYSRVWDGLIAELGDCERHLLLRDYHSPNLIWQAHEEELRRIGLIDFQDAMIGPTAYDVASLVQDARVDIPSTLGDALLAHYLRLRHVQGNFDETSFLKAFAIMSAQRNCKLAGIWVRLKERDGKPGYLKHMPRTLRYLAAVLEHPVLAPLRQWMAQAGIDVSESRT